MANPSKSECITRGNIRMCLGYVSRVPEKKPRCATMSDTKEWHLQPENEYRFELDPESSLAIKVLVISLPFHLPHTPQLLKGHAEIFGAELAEGRSYLFGSECKAAVFTWHGCTIQMSLPLFSSFSTFSSHPYTSPDVHPQSMSQMKPQCQPMPIYISHSSRCGSVHSATCTVLPVPTTINTP